MDSSITIAQAFSWGLTISGPLATLVGIGFALSITANEHINIVPKISAWLLAPVFGLLLGSLFASAIAPSWGLFGVAWFFGIGWTLTFMFAAICGHDDTLYLLGRFWTETLFPYLKRLSRRRRNSTRGRNDDGRNNVRYTLFDDDDDLDGGAA